VTRTRIVLSDKNPYHRLGEIFDGEGALGMRVNEGITRSGGGKNPCVERPEQTSQAERSSSTSRKLLVYKGQKSGLMKKEKKLQSR